MVSVIIPTIPGREKLLDRLLYSLPKGCEVIIVRDQDLLLAAKRNKGASQAKGEFLFFIDDDNYISQGAIDEAITCACGIVGMVACYDKHIFKIADGGSKRSYISGFTKGINTNKSILAISPQPYEVDEVANAFIMRRSLFKLLGGFDEVHFPIELDEADLCYRAKKRGVKIMMCPKAIVYHRSITYSYIPDFRNPRNAYYMGRNRVLYQKIHLDRFVPKLIYFIAALPLFVILYCLCLLWRRKPVMAYHFLKGVKDGISGSTENTY